MSMLQTSNTEDLLSEIRNNTERMGTAINNLNISQSLKKIVFKIDKTYSAEEIHNDPENIKILAALDKDIQFLVSARPKGSTFPYSVGQIITVKKGNPIVMPAEAIRASVIEIIDFKPIPDDKVQILENTTGKDIRILENGVGLKFDLSGVLPRTHTLDDLRKNTAFFYTQQQSIGKPTYCSFGIDDNSIGHIYRNGDDGSGRVYLPHALASSTFEIRIYVNQQTQQVLTLLT